MSEQPEAKLTKKQKKALAHRAGGSSGLDSKKRSAGKARKALRQNIEALPEADLDEGEGQLTQDVVPDEPVVQNKKGSKKRKRNDEASEAGKVDEESAAAQPAKKKPSRQRFICFCGNLPFTATADLIKAHFKAACGQEPSVRVLSSKPKEGSDPSKSKGCAFIEFTNAGALQSALRLHHSLMDKRKINVEISAGGGGKGEKRTSKIEDARKRLGDQRARKVKEKQEKEAKEKAKKGIVDEPEKKKQPQPQKTSKKDAKPWLSGANAMKLG